MTTGQLHALTVDDIAACIRSGNVRRHTEVDVSATKSGSSSIGSTSGAARRRRAEGSAEYRAEQARLAPYETLARMVIARRIRYGLTQEALADQMGTSVPAISRLESGQHRPNVETLERLGEAFGERLVLGFEDSDGVRELVGVGQSG